MRSIPNLADLAADRERAFALTPVSRETAERLDRFVALLLDRQRHVNLVAQSTLSVTFTRHLADSLQLLTILPDALRWLDLGSGGGLPAIPIACALAGNENASVDLVESTGKKADFLREVIATLDLPAHVHGGRIEDFVPKSLPDVVTARALAPLPLLLSYVKPLLKPGGVALLMKGQDVEVELTEAAKSWKMDYRLVPSITNPLAHVLVVNDLKRISALPRMSRRSA